jgi:hypothetical protein
MVVSLIGTVFYFFGATPMFLVVGFFITTFFFGSSFFEVER